jgi:predicted RNA binding protein YcfA (HicA-like mRNA interferase family)
VPRLTPCSRSDFIRKLKNLRYQGPFSGSDHEFMSKPGHGNIKVPNPHQGDISVDLLSRILRDSNISRDDWIKA